MGHLSGQRLHPAWTLDLLGQATVNPYAQAGLMNAWRPITPSKPSEPLPFFLDPDQVAALCPEINWDKRVGDRIEAFRAMANR